MRSFDIRHCVLFLLLSAAAPLSGASEFVLILRAGGTAWRVEEAEKLKVNGKDQVRASSSQAPEVRAEEYKKLTLLKLARAGVLRKHAAGYLAHRDGSNWQPTAPDGLSPKAATTYAALWDAAQITVETGRGAKTVIQAADLFAVLPGGDRDQAVADFLLDEGNFRGLGERNADASFDERMSLLVAVGPALTGAGGAKVRGILLAEMRDADRKVSGSGLARDSDLERGLKFARKSRLAFPNDAEQAKASTALFDRKAWLVQRMAILNALAAGELWDAFLDKYADFERWDNSFPLVHQIRDQALKESVEGHVAKGKLHLKAREFDQALSEFKMALRRSPGDEDIARLIDSTTIEQDKAKPQQLQADPNSTVQIQLTRHLSDEELFIEQSSAPETSATERQADLRDAEKEILEAEKLDKDSPLILLGRARLLNAEEQLLKARDLLDQYERRVPEKDWTPSGAEKLRSIIRTKLIRDKTRAKDKISKAEAEGDYPAALVAVQNGMELDPNDADFLLRGGLNSAILRKSAQAERWLNQYLKLSQGPGSDAGQRDKVYKQLGQVRETVPEPDGVPNWFSGFKSPPGVFYCPISLAFTVPVSEVRGSRKLTASYTWNGDLLTRVTVGGEPGERPFSAYFEYYSSPRSVRRVSTEPMTTTAPAQRPPRLTPDGPVGAGTGVYTAMLNLPPEDPIMVEKLTGKHTAAIVAGNPYFHPFVWDAVYLFMVEYDDKGRVVFARQARGGSPAPGALHNFEFVWDGLKLKEINERGSGNYHRTMTYSGGRLTSESISYNGNGHPAKIDYKYNKEDRLVEAECTNDPSLDGRSRHVQFRQP